MYLLFLKPISVITWVYTVTKSQGIIHKRGISEEGVMMKKTEEQEHMQNMIIIKDLCDNRKY